MRVLVLGASGFVGRHLVERLNVRGDSVTGASLRDPVSAAAEAAGCDAIVNVAGETVGQRWTPAVKQRIERSRVELPNQFSGALSRVNRSAVTYVSASAVGYYPSDPERSFDEASAPGTGFLSDVCVKWEAEALKARELGMRVALIRTGIALASDGGALGQMLPLLRAGLGGRLGSGRQWFSWIHMDDLTGIYAAALDRGEGAFNATAPNPVTNREFTKELARALKRPALFPAPALALRAVLGEAADALLASQRVVPKRTIEDLGYEFTFPALREALTEIAG